MAKSPGPCIACGGILAHERSIRERLCTACSDRVYKAAPDLLVAARAMLKFDVSANDCGSDSGPWQSVELSEAFDALRAAVARALG